MSLTSAYVAAALATAALAAVHALVPIVRQRLGTVREGVVSAIGGGVASAYVFLHLLPELAHGNQEVAEVLGETASPTVLAEMLLFLVAFAGFLLLYGLDHAAVRADRTFGVFSVHVGVFAIYNALITYALPTRFEVGPTSAVLFTLAMAVHFVMSDRSLAEHHGERFRRIGRPVVVAALVAGYLLSIVFAPTRTTVVSVMLAMVGGFVLYTVFNDELPSERRVRFPAFALAAGCYAGILVAVTAIEA